VEAPPLSTSRQATHFCAPHPLWSASHRQTGMSTPQWTMQQ
jgi:hypothetical protein